MEVEGQGGTRGRGVSDPELCDSCPPPLTLRVPVAGALQAAPGTSGGVGSSQRCVVVSVDLARSSRGHW